MNGLFIIYLPHFFWFFSTDSCNRATEEGMLSVFLKVVLFVPSPNYSCPASSACCSYHYCSPMSLACCEFVIACKACKVLYYTCSHYCDCRCITLVRIWLLLFQVLCVLFVRPFKYWFEYEEYEPDRWDPLTGTWQMGPSYQNLTTGTHLTSGPFFWKKRKTKFV